MRTTSLAVSLILTSALCQSANAVQAVVDDGEYALSLLQHSAQPYRKAEKHETGLDPADEARIAARFEKERRKGQRRRESGVQPSDAKKQKRKQRLQAKKAGLDAGTRFFGDQADCDKCRFKCSLLFEATYKQCMIDGRCQPWQKEDGPNADKCNQRCDTSANRKRAPCVRKCFCAAGLSASLIEDNAKITSKVNLELAAEAKEEEHISWANGIHRCLDVPVGEQVSGCQQVAFDNESASYDSIRKCARAAVEANADTFNFFQASVEFARCDLRNCGSGNLQLGAAPAPETAPAGHGNWKVFSTFCAAKPEGQRSLTGPDDSSR